VGAHGEGREKKIIYITINILMIRKICHVFINDDSHVAGGRECLFKHNFYKTYKCWKLESLTFQASLALRVAFVNRDRVVVGGVT
jgi:hypothetical protein